MQDESLAKDMIPKEEFEEILRTQLPLKTAEALNELADRAVVELGLPVTAKFMQFTKLFAEVRF